MAIFFYDEYTQKFNSRNFGDDINPFVFGELLPESIINDDKVCIIGIGTLINEKTIEKVKHFEKKIVFSSGVGYGEKELVFDDTWEFICVRGELSASELGLPRDKAVTDGAILLSDILNVNRQDDGIVTFIPHVNTHWSCGIQLKKICDDLGVNYLVPDVDFDVFINGVAQSKYVITEAMHGAILADTLRVPWHPVKIHYALPFKWKDWCLSMGLSYNPTYLPPLWDVDDLSQLKKLKAFVRVTFFKMKMKAIIKNPQNNLSSDKLFDDKLKQMRQKLKELIIASQN